MRSRRPSAILRSRRSRWDGMWSASCASPRASLGCQSRAMGTFVRAANMTTCASWCRRRWTWCTGQRPRAASSRPSLRRLTRARWIGARRASSSARCARRWTTSPAPMMLPCSAESRLNAASTRSWMLARCGSSCSTTCAKIRTTTTRRPRSLTKRLTLSRRRHWASRLSWRR